MNRLAMIGLTTFVFLLGASISFAGETQATEVGDKQPQAAEAQQQTEATTEGQTHVAAAEAATETGQQAEAAVQPAAEPQQQTAEVSQKEEKAEKTTEQSSEEQTKAEAAEKQ